MTNAVLLQLARTTVVAASVAFLTAALGAQTRNKTVLDGIYSAAQAQNGNAVFASNCVTCHGPELQGGGGNGNNPAPALKGEPFMRSFETDTVARLFFHIKGRMPQNTPGSLPDQQYIDVLAFILESNGYPSGNDALPPDPDLLRSIRIVRKGGPVAAPNSALVRLVGCLDGAANNWVVSKASEPTVTKQTAAATGDDLKDAVDRPLGDGSFKLQQVYDALDSIKGHKVEVRGILVRRPNNDNRISVTSVQGVADDCLK